MGLGSSLVAAFWNDRVPYVTAAVAAMILLIRGLAPPNRKRLRGTSIMLCLYLVLVPLAATLHEMNVGAAREVRLAALIFAALATIGSAGTVVFAVVLPRVRVQAPPILQDIIVAVASIIAIFGLASRSGENLSGLIATSAVLTAVIGLSLQDTIGNIVGGLAVQLDNTIRFGDWIKVGDVQGRVVEVRWRYTAIETRNWETVILPNSTLIKGQVTVLGRRTGQALKWRRWIYFDVDLRTPPTDVIATVDAALQGVPIENVAADPKPHCVVTEFHEHTGKYAVRYWLTELAKDTPTDSVVRTRIYFALKRAGIELAVSTHAVLMSQTSESTAERGREEHERRLRALAKVDLFVGLPEDERVKLADALRHAPFARGELMTRQGTNADWLYMIVSGEASARVTAEGGAEKAVARFGPGDFFGEMSMLTGEPRAATVVALSDMECYTLDSAAFHDVVHRRPEIAEQIADILAKRRAENMAARENLSNDAKQRQVQSARSDLLATIRRFFADDGPRSIAPRDVA